jgi:hypothetical protein
MGPSSLHPENRKKANSFNKLQAGMMAVHIFPWHSACRETIHLIVSRQAVHSYHISGSNRLSAALRATGWHESAEELAKSHVLNHEEETTGIWPAEEERARASNAQ